VLKGSSRKKAFLITKVSAENISDETLRI